MVLLRWLPCLSFCLLTCLWPWVPSALAVTIHDIQYTTDPGGASPYTGQQVAVTGIVTGVFFQGYVLAEAPGPWHAIYVASQSHGPRIGDEVRLTGTVQEYFSMTQIANVSNYTLLSSGNAIAPWTETAQGAGQEMHESTLLTLADLTVTALHVMGEWTASDGTGDIRCDDLNDYMYFPQVGDVLASVTGILFYSGARFKLEPRNTGDVAGAVIPHYVLGGDIVTMNAALDIHPGAYVEILGDRIVGILAEPPAGLPVIATGGLILPGLIDGHNHASYNVLDLIPFGQTYQDRYEWQASPLYAQFRTQLDNIWNYPTTNAQLPNALKLAEVRALCAGTTTMQGRNCNTDGDDYYAQQGMIINNAERFPSRIYSVTFPLRETPAYWQAMQAQYWDRFVIHLSEGVNASALQEFYTWASWGLLDDRTTILHGVPYGPPEWSLMAAAGAHLVWSPASDVYLYGVSPDIPAARAAGVNVAIAPDWTESGCRDMLAEIKFAAELDRTLWGGALEPLDLALMATRNAALAMGAADRIGQLAPGFQADLMVFPGAVQAPYDALLAVEPCDVQLTVVSGRPMYGDVDLMQQFPFLEPLEYVDVCGRPKILATRIDAYSIPQSDKAITLAISELEAAYAQALPRICDFLGAFGCSPAAVGEASPGPSMSLQVQPGPQPNTRALIMDLPAPDWASLRIHDLTGRVLRTLAVRRLAAGRHVVTWDGRVDSGPPAASGIYWARLEAGGSSRTARILITR